MEEEEKLRKVLYEETKTEEIRIQMNIDYENKEEKRHRHDSSIKLKFTEVGYINI